MEITRNYKGQKEGVISRILLPSDQNTDSHRRGMTFAVYSLIKKGILMSNE